MSAEHHMSRRGFLTVASAAGLGLGSGCGRIADTIASPVPAVGLDAFIREKMARDHIPGVAACIVTTDRMVWAGAYGWADLERRVPMTTDTLQNIASISKTFTTMTLMQQWERGGFDLDDDVSDHLPFPVRSPHHPDRAITFRHLLTHRSPIRDGIAYGRAYACRDSEVPIGEWVEEYLVPGGRLYDAEDNFHAWAPGEEWEYCNTSYALLAHLAERIAGRSFPDLSRTGIFDPIGLDETTWFLADVDLSRHAVPYTWVGDGEPRGPAWGGEALGVIRDPSQPPPPVVGAGYRANCAYNHPVYPDGFLRTSVNQLGRYLRAHLRGGELDGQRLLEAATIRGLLTPQPGPAPAGRLQGLTWSGSFRVRGQVTWGHGGSDPGVNTDIRLLPEEGLGAIVFFNTNGADPHEVTHRLLEEAPTLADA